MPGWCPATMDHLRKRQHRSSVPAETDRLSESNLITLAQLRVKILLPRTDHCHTKHVLRHQRFNIPRPLHMRHQRYLRRVFRGKSVPLHHHHRRFLLRHLQTCRHHLCITCSHPSGGTTSFSMDQCLQTEGTRNKASLYRWALYTLPGETAV